MRILVWMNLLESVGPLHPPIFNLTLFHPLRHLKLTNPPFHSLHRYVMIDEPPKDCKEVLNRLLFNNWIL